MMAKGKYGWSANVGSIGTSYTAERKTRLLGHVRVVEATKETTLN
jgi:hypothetical protein